MDYPYRENNISAAEVISIMFVFLMLGTLVFTFVYCVFLHPNRYEYTKDGITEQADFCYTGKADEFICEVDGRRFHVETYRKYRQ